MLSYENFDNIINLQRVSRTLKKVDFFFFGVLKCEKFDAYKVTLLISLYVNWEEYMTLNSTVFC